MLVRYEETDIMDIASAIRSKSGTTEKMRVSEMADRIMAIKIEEPYTPTFEDRTVIPSKELQAVVASAGYDALKMVTILPIPDDYIIPTGTRKITENGTYMIAPYESVEIDVHLENDDSGTIDSSRIDAIYEGGFR